MKSEPTKTVKRGRPSLPLEDAEARNQLIKLGLAYVTTKGFSAVGINEILRKSKIPKGSFYHYFKSKSEFGLQLIESYDEYFCKKLDRCFSNETMSPIQRLQMFTFDAEQGMKRYEFKRGCLVGNLGQEMGALPEGYRDKLIQVFSGWEKRTADCLKLAIEQGEIAEHHDPKDLANYFWIGWEGAVLRAKLSQEAKPLQTFRNSFFSMIQIVPN